MEAMEDKVVLEDKVDSINNNLTTLSEKQRREEVEAVEHVLAFAPVVA